MAFQVSITSDIKDVVVNKVKTSVSAIKDMLKSNKDILVMLDCLEHLIDINAKHNIEISTAVTDWGDIKYKIGSKLCNKIISVYTINAERFDDYVDMECENYIEKMQNSDPSGYPNLIDVMRCLFFFTYPRLYKTFKTIVTHSNKDVSMDIASWEITDIGKYNSFDDYITKKRNNNNITSTNNKDVEQLNDATLKTPINADLSIDTKVGNVSTYSSPTQTDTNTVTISDKVTNKTCSEPHLHMDCITCKVYRYFKAASARAKLPTVPHKAIEAALKKSNHPDFDTTLDTLSPAKFNARRFTSQYLRTMMAVMHKDNVTQACTLFINTIVNKTNIQINDIWAPDNATS